MDLSNLSSTLPSTKPLEQVSLIEINNELTDEFKDAAKSVASLYNAGGRSAAKAEFSTAAKAVASLYRAGTSSTVLSMHRGYLECLDELVEAIAGGEDIENWALTKRAEITNLYNHRDDPTLRELELSPVDPLPSPLSGEHDFDFPPELSSTLQFRPSFPPLSVAYKRSKSRPEQHKKLQSLAHESSPSSDESDGSDSADVELKKRRALLLQPEPKRRKRDTRDANQPS